MSNFVYDNESLPGDKVNAVPNPGPAQNYLDAGDMNEVFGALGDIRTQILSYWNLCAYGADPTGGTDIHASLSNACAAIVAAGGGILGIPQGTYKLASDFTLPAGVVLAPTNAVIVMSTGVALTVQGTVEAPSVQIFSSPDPSPVIFIGPQKRVDITWFGADSTDTTDSSLAIHQATLSCSGQELVEDETMLASPECFFPSGIYKIATGGMNAAALMRGDNAILKASSTAIDFFVGLAFQGNISSLSFYSGRHVFSMSANNSSGTFVFDDIEFTAHAGACFLTDATCDNIDVVATRCRFANSTEASGMIVSLSSGFMTMRDLSGFEFSNVIFYVNGGQLNVDHADLAPGLNGGTWIKVDTGGGSVGYRTSIIDFKHIRFGGEAAMQIVQWSGVEPPASIYGDNGVILDSALTIEDSDFYSTTGQYPAMSFFTLPMVVKFSGNRGYPGFGLYFDPGIPQDEKQAIQSVFTREFTPNTKNVLFNQSDAETSDRLYAEPTQVNQMIRAADLVIAFAPNSGSFTGDGVTVTSPNDEWGIATLTVVATSPTAAVVFNWPAYLANMIIGNYVVAFDIDACSQTKEIIFTVGGVAFPLTVKAGKSVITVPFYKSYTDPSHWATGTAYSQAAFASTAVAMSSTPLAGATTIDVGSTTGFATAGSILVNNTLATGLSAWAPSTSYPSPGAQVTNNNQVYQVVTGGTSASNSGPTGMSDGIADGTVIWKWIGTCTFLVTYSSITGTSFVGCTAPSASGNIATGCAVVSYAKTTAPSLVLLADNTTVLQCIQSGTSDSTGSGPVAPSGGWAPGATVTDGTITWEFLGNLSVNIQYYNVTVGDTTVFGRIRVFSGTPQLTTQNSIIWDTASPSSGEWFQGDKVYNMAPAAGGVDGWICVTSGTPGTWKTFGQIST